MIKEKITDLSKTSVNLALSHFFFFLDDPPSIQLPSKQPCGRLTLSLPGVINM